MTVIKIWKTEKIEKIVKSAIEQMPEEATNIQLIEGYRHSAGALGTHSNWTEVEAVYKDDNGDEIGRIRTIDKHGGWEYSDPANYVLYCMGLYKPYSKDNLTSIRARYEDNLDNNFIYPIKNIVSDIYKLRSIVNEIIANNETNEVTLTYVVDYDYLENHFKKNRGKMAHEYAIKSRITYNDVCFTFKHCRNFFKNTMILEEVSDKLKEVGINVIVDYDMKEEDWEFTTSHWRKWWLE